MKKPQQRTVLFLFGFIGILSLLPVLPQLFAISPEPLPMSIPMLMLVSVVQSSILLALMVWLGSVFSKKVYLQTPVATALVNSEDVYSVLKPQLIPALIGGVVGGVFILIFSNAMLSYLPVEFLAAGEKLNPPWYSKILYGGITEEILIRWGVMSFLVWAVYRITQKKDSKIKAHNYVIAIILSALIFGIGHLPAASILSPIVTTPLLFYIVLGNAGFGLIAGYLYWKYGLECAILSHMLAHIVMMLGASLI